MTVKRYRAGCEYAGEEEMIQTDDGAYVSHEDYATLLAERDALNQQVVTLAVENAALTSGCGFFAYDPDNGFEEFKTKEEAITAAESYIDYYRGDACDGWADEVSQVSWGVIMQESTKVDERPKNEDDSVSDYIDTVCDFALLPEIAHPATDAAIANIQAQGVKMFAKELGSPYADGTGETYQDGFNRSIEVTQKKADKFAQQLRKVANND